MNHTILGASGFIGRSLKSYLEARGLRVLTPRVEEILVANEDWGVIYYCIGLTSDFRTRPFSTVEAHIEILSQVLQVCRFQSLIYLSSARVYSNSLTTTEDSDLLVNPHNFSDLYNISKLMGESLCLSSGRHGIRIARISNVIGIGQNSDTFVGSLLQGIKSGRISMHSHPESLKDYIGINDVTELLLEIASRGQLVTYNVASGTSLSISEIVDILRQETKCIVEMNPTESRHQFPSIDIQRISKEFHFQPKSIREELRFLLTAK